MGREEIGMKEFWKFQDLHTHEAKVNHAYVDKMLHKGYSLLETKRFNHVATTEINEKVEKKIKTLKESLKKYKGSKSVFQFSVKY